MMMEGFVLTVLRSSLNVRNVLWKEELLKRALNALTICQEIPILMQVAI